jgi:hypothetical protein
VFHLKRIILWSRGCRSVLALFAAAGMLASACGGAAVAPTPDPSAAIASAVAAALASERAAVAARLTPTPLPTPRMTPTPTPIPTASPTPTPAPTPLSYAALNARDWALVMKAPDAYIGKALAVWGCIFQFDAATGTGAFLARASNLRLTYWYSDGSTAKFHGDNALLAPFVKGDVVVMDLVVLGSYTYDTQSGGNTTVPNFRVATIANRGSC